MDTSHADPAPAAAGAATSTLTDTGTQLLRDMQAAYTALQDFQNDALKKHIEFVRPAIQPLLDQHKAAVTAYREHLGRSSTGRPAELAEAYEMHAKKGRGCVRRSTPPSRTAA